MWTFLNSLLEILKKVDWQTVWSELVKVPKFIKNLLMVCLIIGIGYFSYIRVHSDIVLADIQKQVQILNFKVQDVLTTDDYNVDIEYMILTLYLLQELNEQQFETTQMNTKALIRHLENKSPDSPLLFELRQANERLYHQHVALKAHFNNGIKKFDPTHSMKLED